MNRGSLLTCFLMLFVATPALAMDGKACTSKAAQLKPAERDAFMKSCLAQLSSPANTKELEQQHKQAQCEQNAKNQHAQGNEKAAYVSACMNKNEAVAAAKAEPTHAADKALAEKPVRKVSAEQTAKKKPAKSCAQQAKEKGLKGDERKQFIASCKKG
jgi:hypothetical protein